METKTTSLMRQVLPLAVVALAAWGCGSDADRNADGSLRNGEVNVAAGGMDTVVAQTNLPATGVAAATDTDRYNAMGDHDPNGHYDIHGVVITGVVLTPVQERTDATDRMNGIRATLMTELDQVRARLKDGKLDKEQTTADQKRAAELAQGLERVDRTLKAMGEATDATWPQMRASQLKEVDEVRTWWNQYMTGRDASAVK